ncbi:MAG TPA: hypothetical protein VFZ59_05985 [Verrucomicrobiae bacterium]|nr:hypothetical protein [Verrucomicrobiae bacterium]
MNFATPYDCVMPKRLTLEQRIRKLARRYRAQQRREAAKASRDRSSQRRTASWASTIGLAVLMQFALCSATASTFETANADFVAGRFADAAHGFERVIAEHGYSAPVLFNLGNAWMKTGQPGRAILNYERAWRLAPDDAAIRANLNLARQKAGVAVNKNPFREKVARVSSFDTLAWAIVWAAVLLFAVVVTSRLLPSFPRVVKRGVVVMAAFGVFVAGAGMALQWPERDRAVVLDSNATVQIAPADAAGILFNLPEGETVRAIKSHNSYTLIRLRDGRSGWVKSSAVERVCL